MRHDDDLDLDGCDERPLDASGGRARLLLLWLLGVPLPIILLIWLFAGSC
jgi:hypothetical protein